MMTSQKQTTFGEFIRKSRKEKGLTLTKLAAQLDLDSANLSKIENGIREFDSKRLKSLAEALQLEFEKVRREYITDSIGKIIYETNCSHELLLVAEKKANYLRNKNQNPLT